MRLLHTSDWHLGAALEGVSRDDDHALFFAWLRDVIVEREVDVLVVSGDVFDQATPSAEAQRRFFGLLGDLAALRTLTRVIVVGGNHDSAARLEAPADVLAALRIDVVGELPSDRERCLIDVRGRDGTEVTIAAVPYVHEWRLGVRGVGATAVADGFRELYARLADRATERSRDARLIATGHLTVGSWTETDAPRAIHGASVFGALSADIFDERFAYVALGHIHRAGQVGVSRGWYAGSAVPISVDEAAPRRVLLVDVGATGEARVESIFAPIFREIVRLEGDEDEIVAGLRAVESAAPLPPFVVPRVIVPGAALGLERRLRDAALARGDRSPLALLAPRIAKPAAPAPTERLVPPVREATPATLFAELCRARGVELDDSLRHAFESLLADPS